MVANEWYNILHINRKKISVFFEYWNNISFEFYSYQDRKFSTDFVCFPQFFFDLIKKKLLDFWEFNIGWFKLIKNNVFRHLLLIYMATLGAYKFTIICCTWMHTNTR